MRRRWDLGGEIIDKSKLIRNQIRSRLISTITGMIATLPMYKSKIYEIIEGTQEYKRTVRSF